MTTPNTPSDRFASAEAFELSANADAVDTSRLRLDLIKDAVPVVDRDGVVSLQGKTRAIKLSPLAARQYASTVLGDSRIITLQPRLTPKTLQSALEDMRDTALAARGREDSPGAILYRKSNGVARAIVGPQYAPVFDAQVLPEIARAAHSVGMITGEGKAQRGAESVWLRRSEERSTISYRGPEPIRGSEDFGGLCFGLMSHNSEVGCASLSWGTTLYRHKCRNMSIRVTVAEAGGRRRHVGDALGWLREQLLEVPALLEQMAKTIVAKARAASMKAWVEESIAVDADAAEPTALERATAGLRRAGLTQDQAARAWAARLSEENRDIAPTHSVWSVVQGITSIAKGEDQEIAMMLQQIANGLLDGVPLTV